MELPEINQRIQILIDKHANSRINRFAKMCNMSSAYKLNRLFLIDKRTKKYPVASLDIITQISDRFPEVDLNWLITGKENTNMLVNEDAAVYETAVPEVLKSLDKFITDIVNRETGERISQLNENVITLLRRDLDSKSNSNNNSLEKTS